MSLLWARLSPNANRPIPEERRVRDYLDERASVSESVASLSRKLGLRYRTCQRVLNQLAEEGVVRRHDFADMEPLYTRFAGR